MLFQVRYHQQLQQSTCKEKRFLHEIHLLEHVARQATLGLHTCTESLCAFQSPIVIMPAHDAPSIAENITHGSCVLF